MWGTFVEGEIEQARDKASNEKQANQKVQMLLKTLLRQDEDDSLAPGEEEESHSGREIPPPARGKYRDPASVIRTSE